MNELENRWFSETHSQEQDGRDIKAHLVPPPPCLQLPYHITAMVGIHYFHGEDLTTTGVAVRAEVRSSPACSHSGVTVSLLLVTSLPEKVIDN